MSDPLSIPFSIPDIAPSDIEAVTDVLTSGWLTTGEQCYALERELADFLGGPRVVAVASCTHALEIALAWLRLRPGSRVGVPTWTFVATALAVERAGGVPVLLDVDPATLNLGVEAIDAAGHLDALVPVHFGGVPVDAEVHRVAQERGIPVVEDAAHALGAVDHRGPISGKGSIAACFSFYATKNLTSGEGGALATHDDEFAAFATEYRLHGLSSDAASRYRKGGTPDYDLMWPGIKANLPDVLAALARSQLRRFEAMQARRRTLVEAYHAALDGSPVRLVPAVPATGSADHLVVVELPPSADRAAVARRLADRGVGTSVHFRPLHTFTYAKEHWDVGAGGVVRADEKRARVLSLPLYPALSVDQVVRVCEELLQALGAA